MYRNYNALGKSKNAMLKNEILVGNDSPKVTTNSSLFFSLGLICCLFFATFSSNAQTNRGVVPPSNTIYQSYAILNLNGGGSVYYDMNAATANPDFQGNALGAFNIGSGSLVVRGGQNKTNKCNGGDIFNGHLYWRYWRTSAGASGAFTSELMSFVSNDGGSCGGDQTWESLTGSTNIISGILPGSYSLEVYSDADGVPGTTFSNNGGANYIANFTVPAPDNVLLYSGTNVAGGTYYNTLKLAFDAINAGTYTGNLHIRLYGDTTESASAVLNASGTGSASYTALDIKPDSGAARTISGAIVGHLIDLNGADNVTIDGLNTGGNSLTISNTSTGATSAIRFANDASNNIVQKATLSGSTSTSFGVVYFGGGTVTGNDGNNINNCTITGAGANLPLNGIFSVGTSAAIDNSGNTINANNISDYFNTAAPTSGIQLGAGNSGWTITNNKLFQTATRLYTVSGTHNGISVQSGAAYTISGNVIGYANASGTGTTNIVGSSLLPAGFPGLFSTSGTANATRYIAINCAFTAGGAVSSIQNNTLAGFALYTSSGATTTNGIWCGINVTTGSADIGTTTGNTIGATSGTGSIYTVCTTSGGTAVGIFANTANTINIQNNTIGAIDAMGTTASISGGVTGINTSGAGTFTVSGNTVGNATNPNIRTGNLTTGASLSNVGTTNGTATGLGRVAGILNLATGPVTIGTQALPNMVRNMYQNSTGTTAASSNIGISAQAAGATTISYNTVTNLTSMNAYTAVGNGDVSCMGIQIRTGGATSTINNNTISNLASNNTTAIGTNVTGISTAAQTNMTIRNNTIYDLINLSTSTTVTAPGTASGILIRSGVAGAGTNIYNNMISLGNGQSTNTSFIGIWGQHGSTPDPIDQIYYNTVRIQGNATSGAQPSFAFVRSDFTAIAKIATVDLRNNIFHNSRISSGAGTGKHYAIGNNYGATASAVGWGTNASNFNLLNSADPATVGFWTVDQTFAAWKAISVSDVSSVSGYPVTFVSNSNLHLNMGVTATPIESGGTPITGLTVDFDNDNRPGPTGSVNGGALAPDIGADEFDGVFLDLIGPTISYTPLSFTCATGARTLVATITDPSGVPTAGAGLPVLYWRINAGAYTAATASSLGSGQYQFTFGAGVALADVVSYYIVAQDNLGNTGASPFIGATGFTANPPAAATPPSSPNNYAINSVLAAGTYTVGSGGTYATLTAAINDYNIKCLSGPVVFELISASYAETAMTISKHPNGSAVNTLTIRPASGVSAAVTATVASGPVLKILGNYVTIDGSNNGTSSRNLTLSNLSTTGPNVVVIGSTGTSPITNVVVKNSTLINGANTATAIITSDGTTVGTAGYFNNITIQNNSIQRAYIGSYNIAAVVAGNGSGLLITQNDLNTSGANSIRLVGIYAQGIEGATISNNNIGNMANTADTANVNGVFIATGTSNFNITGNTLSGISGAATSPIGIRIATASLSTNSAITGNTVSGLTSSFNGAGPVSAIQVSAGGGIDINKNNIFNIKSTNAAGWGANGIQLSSALTAANIKVFNNFIYDVAAVGFAGGTPDDNGYGIVLSAGGGYGVYYNTVNMNTNQTATTGLPAAINIAATMTTPGSVDIRNNIFNNSQTVGTERYSILCGAASNVFSTINYNDYYTTGANLGFIGSNRLDLAAIQAGFGGNANSKNVAPVFVNPASDLHLIPASNTALDNFGTPIAGITTDYDNTTRSATAPDMGADEFSNSSIVNLKFFIEGYYIAASGLMRPVNLNQGVGASATDVETFTLELHNATAPYAMAASTTAMLQTNGNAVCTFSSAPSGSYYLVIKTRNAIDTWSGTPQTVGGSALTYDFSSAANKAYGNNMVDMNGSSVFGLYSGDIDPAHDGNIDTIDYPIWEDDSNNFASGPFATDLNGDGNVDTIDYPIWESNSNNFVSVAKP